MKSAPGAQFLTSRCAQGLHRGEDHTLSPRKVRAGDDLAALNSLFLSLRWCCVEETTATMGCAYWSIASTALVGEFSSVPPVSELKSHQCSESCARFSPSPPLCLLLTPYVELVNISLDLLGYELQYLFLNTNSCWYIWIPTYSWPRRNYICNHCGIEPVEPEEAGFSTKNVGDPVILSEASCRQTICGMGQWMLVPLGMAWFFTSVVPGCARPILDDWRIYHPN